MILSCSVGCVRVVRVYVSHDGHVFMVFVTVSNLMSFYG